ncbi:MAG TPA: hypothetical protein VF375_11310 [Candidatus Limnocylindrales bacterium]
MSFEEKGVWIYGVLVTIVSGAYFGYVLNQARTTNVADIAYQIPLLISIGAVIVLTIVGQIVAAIVTRDCGKTDQRDKEIDRHGELHGYYVLSAAFGLVLLMTMLKVEYFWIANAMYLGGVLGTLASSVVKIVAYRRGF